MTKPAWEHGFRVHGFWSGERRVGRVSIGPRGLTRVKTDGYGCEYTDPAGKVYEFHARTLAEGKREVERRYMRDYPPPEGAETCYCCEEPGHDCKPVRPRLRWGNALTRASDTGFSAHAVLYCYACRRANAGAYARG